MRLKVIFSILLSLLLLCGQVQAAVTATRGVRVSVKDDVGGTKTLALYDKITAVIIGIDRYQNLDAKAQLNFAVRDAKGVEQVLRERYPVSNIVTLFDEQATRENIMKVLQGEMAGVGPDDAVIVYYAGHGITRSPKQQKLGYLIPFDGSIKPEEMYKNISMQQIGVDISQIIPAKHVLFIMDACFGGLLLSTRGVDIEPSHKLAYLEEITRESARQIITAGGENEEVLDGGMYGHSVFTGRLIEALKNNKDFLTAQELGMELERRVYGDARARGHKQKPQVGRIYGTGDFVFIPDLDKLNKEAIGEVTSIETEMRELERLKSEASKRRDEAGQRELERQQLLKDAELKQAKMRRNAVAREAEMKKKAEEDAARDVETQQRQEAEQRQRLASLKVQAEKMRREMGSPAAALGLEEAKKEVLRINALLAKMAGNFDTEQQRQLGALRDHYQPRIEKAEKQPPFDKMFETEAEYKARLARAKSEAESLRAEQKKKEDAVMGPMAAERAAQRKPLQEQLDRLLAQEFPVGAAEIKWKFGQYIPEKETFSLSGAIAGAGFLGTVEVPRARAREYYQNSELLVASATLAVGADGEALPRGLALQGPAADAYKATVSAGHTDAATGMEFIRVAGGCFQMGDTFGDGNSDKNPVHEVCVRDYYLGKYEVTQGEWDKVMGNNPSDFKKGSRYPVENVSWVDAQEFIKKLNAKTGKKYRLPTEAEWEFAARSGGKKEKWSGTSEESALGAYAWYNNNSGGSTHEVGTKNPNGLGLHDMAGNVWEWTNDWFADNYYRSSPRDNPPGPSTGSSRVIRGGCWRIIDYIPWATGSAYRDWNGPAFRAGYLGFRLVLPPGQ